MLTVSFLREFFLKSCHQQSSQSSLSAYASLLQGDTLSKQSNLLIPPVFISQKTQQGRNPDKQGETASIVHVHGNTDTD